MFCSKCGNKLDDDAVFCSACGNKVASNQNVNTQQQTDNATQQSVYTQQANQQTNQYYSYGQGVPYGNQQTVNYQTYQVSYGNSPLEELRKKLQIDMIIWIVVASIQAILAVYFFYNGNDIVIVLSQRFCRELLHKRNCTCNCFSVELCKLIQDKQYAYKNSDSANRNCRRI